METTSIELDRTKARELWRDYRKHVHWSAPIDRDVMMAYQAIAQGKAVVRALESIRKAGLDAKGFPMLAIARADAAECFVRMSPDGSAVFAIKRDVLWSWNDERAARSRQRVDLAAGSFPAPARRFDGHCLVPQVPLPLRPKRGLANYHVLFEADWSLAPPVDPLLLRRVGRTDLWVVCAAWDLTEIERAALAGSRIHA